MLEAPHSNYGFDTPLLERRLDLAAVEFIEGRREAYQLIGLLVERVGHPLQRRTFVAIGSGIDNKHPRLSCPLQEFGHGLHDLMTALLGIFTSGIQVQDQEGRSLGVNGYIFRLGFVGHWFFLG